MALCVLKRRPAALAVSRSRLSCTMHIHLQLSACRPWAGLRQMQIIQNVSADKAALKWPAGTPAQYKVRQPQAQRASVGLPYAPLCLLGACACKQPVHSACCWADSSCELPSLRVQALAERCMSKDRQLRPTFDDIQVRGLSCRLLRQCGLSEAQSGVLMLPGRCRMSLMSSSQSSSHLAVSLVLCHPEINSHGLKSLEFCVLQHCLWCLATEQHAVNPLTRSCHDGSWTQRVQAAALI